MAVAFLIVPVLCIADAGDKQVVEVYSCSIKDGKKIADVEAHNAKWLAFVRQTSPGISSYGMERIVGDGANFVFADIYPDLAAWSATKQALHSDAGMAIEAGFGELLDCDSNRLYYSTEH